MAIYKIAVGQRAERMISKYPNLHIGMNGAVMAVLPAFIMAVSAQNSQIPKQPQSGSPPPPAPSYFSSKVKFTETLLSAVSAVLIALTYATLIGAGARIASTSKIPRLMIEKNISALLTAAWPDTGNSIDYSKTMEQERDDGKPDAIRLMYVGRMGETTGKRRPRGLRECEAMPNQLLERSPLWLTSGSKLTMAIVQLAVWEWLTIWLVLLMLASVLLYNGFFAADLAADSFPRLTVSLIYTVAFVIHALYVWRSCRGFFTMVGQGAAWSMLNNAGFATVDMGLLKKWLEGPRDAAGSIPLPLEFREIDKASAEFIPSTFPVDFGGGGQNSGVAAGTSPLSPPAGNLKEIKQSLATIRKIRETSRESAEKAVETALERTIANAMTLVGITISSGFAVWTSRLTNTDSMTLGSLALLASLSFGVASMFTSAVQLGVLNNSYRMVLMLKEVIINMHEVEHIKKRSPITRPISFTQGTINPQPARLRDLIRATPLRNLMHILLLGPAYILLPTKEDQARQSSNTQFQLDIIVRGESVVLTTRPTDKHSKDEKGENVESLNVCYRPKGEDSLGVDGNVV
ncbi:MAG: hypothetical protein M1839_005166 [Geoglossum umbratile]|nr:MAG: hypothetical protein M1839_005166 [Geoglossum umbratile]